MSFIREVLLIIWTLTTESESGMFKEGGGGLLVDAMFWVESGEFQDYGCKIGRDREEKNFIVACSESAINNTII